MLQATEVTRLESLGFKNSWNGARKIEQYSQIEPHLGVKTAVKFARTVERLPISQGHQIPEIIDMTKDIQVFRVSYVRPLGAKFRSSKGFVAAIEEMLLLFYEGVVQNSQSWTPPHLESIRIYHSEIIVRNSVGRLLLFLLSQNSIPPLIELGPRCCALKVCSSPR